MADIINLKSIRKARAKADATALAEQNRVRFGRTKTERVTIKREVERSEKTLDGHKLAPLHPLKDGEE